MNDVMIDDVAENMAFCQQNTLYLMLSAKKSWLLDAAVEFWNSLVNETTQCYV